MARKYKQPVHHVQMTDGKRAIIQQLLKEYENSTFWLASLNNLKNRDVANILT